MGVLQHGARRHFRSVWISDVHLGYHAARAESLLAFLHGIECEYLYLVGDIAYHNCGDWVESCTALVEHRDGSMELLEWNEARAVALPMQARATAA